MDIVMRNSKQVSKHPWLNFPDDLAWDIFTLDCMLAALLAMLVAGLASFSARFAQLVADHERWLWVSGATLAIIAAVSLLRVVWPAEQTVRPPWQG
jgi:hypothetical protein